MRRVLIIGVRGLVGGALGRELSRRGIAWSGPASSEVDARDLEACRRTVRELRATAVIDCARPGRMADRAPIAANLARAASEAGAHSVHLSSCAVFDGATRSPRPEGGWLESDEPCPAGAAGHAELAMERLVAVENRRHLIVRTSAVFAGRDVEGELAWAPGVSLRVCPTPVDDLAAAIVRLVVRPAYGIVHVAGSGVLVTSERAAGGGHLDLVLRTRRQEVPPLADWRLAVGRPAVGGLPDRSPADEPPTPIGRRRVPPAEPPPGDASVGADA